MYAENNPSVALSQTERECLKWLAQGKSDHEIAMIMQVSAASVPAHIQRIIQKFRVTTRAQAIVCGWRQGDLR